MVEPRLPSNKAAFEIEFEAAVLGVLRVNELRSVLHDDDVDGAEKFGPDCENSIDTSQKRPTLSSSFYVVDIVINHI